MPDVPTLAESGYPGFDVANWHGIVLPAATPKEIVARLHEEIVKAACAPDVQQRIAPLSVEIIANRPDEMQAQVNAERERYGKVIRALNIKLD